MDAAGAIAGFGWIAAHPWAYPALEAVHIAGIALLVGPLALLELRVWGAFGPALPLAALARAALVLAWGGFAVAATSGAAMLATQPAELLANDAFRVKLALLALAGLNAAWFHRRGGVARIDAVARAQTALSLGVWFAVIIAGRFIGYR